MVVAHAAAFNPDGGLSEEVTSTLLDLVEKLHSPLDDVFNALLDDVAAGRYEPNELSQSDFSINATFVWLRAPWVQSGEMMISHEYVSCVSSDEGHPQKFTIQQFRAVLSFWKAFMKQVEAAGLEASVGFSQEMHI